MRDEDFADMAFTSDGNLNVSYVLAQANVLYKEGEIELAASLFRLVAAQERMAHCGFFGIGRCLMKMNKPQKAISAFEKALSIAERPYIAIALLDAIVAAKDFELGEKRALELATKFVNSPDKVEQLRNQYEICVLARRKS